MTEFVARHGLIAGRVQGVGFRAFVARCARQSGLAGWVRNTADGRVEFRVGGDAGRVAAFELACRRGPRLARVDEVTMSDCEAVSAARGFEILSDE